MVVDIVLLHHSSRISCIHLNKTSIPIPWTHTGFVAIAPPWNCSYVDTRPSAIDYTSLSDRLWLQTKVTYCLRTNENERDENHRTHTQMNVTNSVTSGTHAEYTNEYVEDDNNQNLRPHGNTFTNFFWTLEEIHASTTTCHISKQKFQLVAPMA